MSVLESTYTRHNRIGGVAANIIANKRVYNSTLLTLWKELTGQTEPKDLSNVLPVQMGIHTERFNRFWFQKVTGYTVEELSSVQVSRERDYCVAQVDGIATDSDGTALFEAKHTGTYTYENGKKTIEEVQKLYYAQIQHYLYVTELDRAYLSVFFGNSSHAYSRIQRDDEFIARLLKRIDAFWKLVEDRIPPKMDGTDELDVPDIEVVPGKVIEIDGDHPSSNQWAYAASELTENAEAASTFEAAKKLLKDLAVPDAYQTKGYGVTVTRKGKRRFVDAT